MSASPSAAPAAADLQHIERKLAEERRLLRALIDAVPDPIFCKDREGRYLLHNIADQHMFGIEGDEFLGKTVFDYPGLKEHAKIYHADDMHVIGTGEPVVNREEPFTRPDGTPGWFLTSKFPLRNPAGEIIGLVGIARDITLRRNAEQKLAEEQQLLRTLIDAIPDPIFFKDRDGRHLELNKAAETFFGCSREELIGKTVFEWPMPRELAEQYAADDRNVIEAGNPLLDREEPFESPSGRRGWLLTSKYPLRDGAGEIYGLVGIARDITEARRIEEERQAFERKLQETQKLESLGVLAGGIAHDFNNLLTGVLGNASLARMDSPADSPIQAFLQQIEVAATRAAELCRQMLAYSGKGHFVVQRLDLNAVLHETANLLHVSISKKAALRFQLAASVPPVLADVTQIRQIIMNLVINASEAIGEQGGEIRVSTGVTRAGGTFFAGTHLAPELPEGEYAWIEVRDDGSGMTPEVQARIFDPFFTTKFTGRGLGLAAVLGIVRGHGGAIKVESDAGRGTAFRVWLPAVEGAQAIAPEPASPAPAGWRGSGTILVIDDEETVRFATARMLGALGFNVLLASDGRLGADKFAETCDSIRLVLLDLTMPHVDGEQALRMIHQIDPAARVLVMSGFNEQEVLSRFAGQEVAGFIQKPFRMADLREKVRAALASESESGQ